jgi:hypothetical protein
MRGPSHGSRTSKSLSLQTQRYTPFFRIREAHIDQLPLGEIVGILRRSVSINDFPVLLTLDLRTPLSPAQVIQILQNVMTTLASQIQDLEKEIAEAESMSLLRAGEQEVLNEEGLPIKEIKENVVDDEETRRGVSAIEEVPERVYTMQEIDRMMDEAEAEEQAEQHSSREMAVEDPQDEEEESSVTAVAGDGLDVGEVNGEELIAKLMDESKKHYNPLEETWEDEESDEASEEEEDEFGRTRGYLIPPNLSKSAKQERSVKFASFEKPASPSVNPPQKPVKSALKKSSTSQPIPSVAPVQSTPTTMMMDIVERIPQKVYPFTLPSNYRIPRKKIPKAHVKSVDSKHLDNAFNQGRYYSHVLPSRLRSLHSKPRLAYLMLDMEKTTPRVILTRYLTLELSCFQSCRMLSYI